MQVNKVHHGDCLGVMKEWPPECVDMVVTSPPYWGLRDYQVDGQLGLEKTPEEYIGKLVAIFREVRRVLKPWGGAWLNLGDSYATGHKTGTTDDVTGWRHGELARGYQGRAGGAGTGNLKTKDLCMIPARVALALQADKWWLRSDIIWAKPNPMPESVTDRPTSSYEHVFLLTKSAKYFYDAEAVKQENTASTMKRRGTIDLRVHGDSQQVQGGRGEACSVGPLSSGANLRNVWTINTQPYPGAHFATFPEELPRRCILAGTSAKGNCAECGKPWVRVVETTQGKPQEDYTGLAQKDYAGAGAQNPSDTKRRALESMARQSSTVGWQPSCKCKTDTVPAIVLDPFFGSGTVGKVATDLGRNWLGIEISGEYIEQAKRRTAMRGLHEAQ